MFLRVTLRLVFRDGFPAFGTREFCQILFVLMSSCLFLHCCFSLKYLRKGLKWVITGEWNCSARNVVMLLANGRFSFVSVCLFLTNLTNYLRSCGLNISTLNVWACDHHNLPPKDVSERDWFQQFLMDQRSVISHLQNLFPGYVLPKHQLTIEFDL